MPVTERFALAASVVAGLALADGGASGAVIGLDDYEPPTYVAGTQIEDSDGVAINGGVGFTGQDIVDAQRTAVTVGSDGLSLLQSLRIGGAANNNDLITRTFATQSGSPLYFSYLFRTTTGSGATTDDDFIQVGLSDAAGEPKNSIGFGATTATLFLRVGAGNTNQQQTAAFPAAGVTYRMVGKLSMVDGSSTYNQMDFFLNPVGLIEPTPTMTRTATAGTGASSVDRLTVRTARLDASDIYTLDDIRVATSFAEVVPEPAGAALFGTAVLGLLAARRRRLTR